MISVIVPVYNALNELKQTLKSLVWQSYSNFEIIVVDDGSTPEIKDAKLEISNLDIKFFRIEHAGAPKARNYGFSKAHGEYVLFCDADMILDKYALAKMKKVLDENPLVDFVYSDFKYGWKKFKFWEFNIDKLKSNNYINTCSMIRRKKVVKWDENLKRFQDWDFWLTVTERGSRGFYLPEILFKANVRHGRISAWLPKCFYNFYWLPKVKAYHRFKEIIKRKHHLN